MAVSIRCYKHPTYTAKRAPKTCAGCWRLYRFLHGRRSLWWFTVWTRPGGR